MGRKLKDKWRWGGKINRERREMEGEERREEQGIQISREMQGAGKLKGHGDGGGRGVEGSRGWMGQENTKQGDVKDYKVEGSGRWKGQERKRDSRERTALGQFQSGGEFQWSFLMPGQSLGTTILKSRDMAKGFNTKVRSNC